MKNKVKVILFDMDGTLLSSQKKIPDEFEKVFYQLQEKGMTLGIASGRPLENLQSYFPNIHKEMVFVCENGGMVAYKDSIISMETIPVHLVKKVIHKWQTMHDCSLLLCAEKATYHQDENALLMRKASNYYPNLVKVDNLDDVEDLCLKMTMYDYDDSSKNTYPALRDLDVDLVAASSAIDWCDINYRKVSKAKGAEKLLAHMGLTFDALMMFGDEGNDFEILSAAKYGVAMKNAIPKIKAICDYECDTNDNNGIMKMLKEEFAL